MSPNSGNHTVNSKGVHREVESEDFCSPITGEPKGVLAANIWSDEQKLHIRHMTADETARQVKVR